MSYRKVSKDSWRYKAVQLVIQTLIGKVEGRDNIIYPFDDLVGHGVLVLPYYRRNGTIYALIGGRNYGAKSIQGHYSTLIGYAGEFQHSSLVYNNLLSKRGGLKSINPDRLTLHHTCLAKVDNEFRDQHNTLTSVYSYELDEGSDSYWEMAKCQEESLNYRTFHEAKDIYAMIRDKKFGQPHEAEIIRKLIAALGVTECST